MGRLLNPTSPESRSSGMEGVFGPIDPVISLATSYESHGKPTRIDGSTNLSRDPRTRLPCMEGVFGPFDLPISLATHESRGSFALYGKTVRSI